MSVRILTIEEAKKVEQLAKKFNEYFRGVVGKAKQDFVCDNSNDVIPKGSYCVHTVLLDSYDHPNRELQESSVSDFIEILK